MNLTFPHMGNLYIPLKALMNGLDVNFVVPPRPTQKTVSLGVRYSPEFACFPLKMTLGNYIEAHELGADTILMAGGIGPCRFGYYAQVQHQILKDQGYDLDMIVLEPPRGHMNELRSELRRLKIKARPLDYLRAARLAWKKLIAVETVEKGVSKERPHKAVPSQLNRLARKTLKSIDEASNGKVINEIISDFLQDLSKLPRRDDIDPKRKPVRVGIVGEIYMVLEPFANRNVEEVLGNLGAHVDRSIFLSDWVIHHVFLDALRLDALRLRRSGNTKEAARPYLGHFVGGEGLESVGNTVLYKRKGFDGVVQVMPFTCMPEIVAQSVLVKVGNDLDMPVLHLTLDEHTGEAGLQTRLEAFVDLLEWRRKHKGVAAG